MGSYSWAKLATLAGPSIKTNAGHGHNDFTVQQKWQQQQRRENVLFGQHFCEAGLAGWLAGCVTFWPAVCTSIAHRNAIRINYNHGFNEFLTPCTWPKERDGLTVAHDSLEHPLLAKLPSEQPLTINTNRQNDCRCGVVGRCFGCQCGITIFNKPKNYATWITIGQCTSISAATAASQKIKPQWKASNKSQMAGRKYLCSCYGIGVKALQGLAGQKEW